MQVGKRRGRKSCGQDDINEMMVQLARQGRHVVRLKGGDPMIFGSGGEEIACLRAASIPVDVVPGITAALGAAASLGVSLTHRDCAQSVRFVTGHARDGALPADFDWRGLADPCTTLMVYMGGRTARQLALRLLAEGLASSTPVVILADISRPKETRHSSTLGELAANSGQLTGHPVLLGIGQVFQAAMADNQDSAPQQRMALTG